MSSPLMREGPPSPAPRMSIGAPGRPLPQAPSPLGTLDSGMAVHSYTGMWISWTLRLHAWGGNGLCRGVVRALSRSGVGAWERGSSDRPIAKPLFGVPFPRHVLSSHPHGSWNWLITKLVGMNNLKRFLVCLHVCAMDWDGRKKVCTRGGGGGCLEPLSESPPAPHSSLP